MQHSVRTLGHHASARSCGRTGSVMSMSYLTWRRPETVRASARGRPAPLSAASPGRGRDEVNVHESDMWPNSPCFPA